MGEKFSIAPNVGFRCNKEILVAPQVLVDNTYELEKFWMQ